jgi:sugar (pentulose or hexulose) kinase
VPEGAEFGARGAALLAGVGIGVFSTVARAAAAGLRFARTYEPEPSRKARYDGIFEVYRMLRTAVRPAWQRSAEMLSQ